jgi:2-hydroxy-6-oxonona-2,4-dienedioate hydrolase
MSLGALLPPALRVIAPSRPGYLRIPLASGPTPTEQAEVARSLLDSLGVHSVAVVGVSGGGMAAVALARDHPERVTRLVLWKAVTRRLPLDFSTLTRAPLAWDLSAWLMLRRVRLAPRLLLPRAVTRSPRSLAALTSLAATSFPIDPRRDGISRDEVQAHTLPGAPLTGLRLPTLVIHGDKDDNVPYQHSEAATQALPGARLVTVTGGDHTTTLVDSTALEAIEAFLVPPEEARRRR